MKFIISFIFGTTLLIYTFHHFEITETFNHMEKANLSYIMLALLLLMLAYLIRAKRWTVWEKDLKYWDSFKLILVGFMGNNILPARLGEILRAHCAAQKIDNRFGRTATLASIVVERIFDGFVIAVIGAIALLTVPMGKPFWWPLVVLCILFFLITALLFATVFFHKRIRLLLEIINGVFPGHLTRFGKEKLNYFLDGLVLIRSFGRVTKALFYSFLIWGTELLMFYMVGNAVYDGLSAGNCFVWLTVENFASLFPFTFGGVGAIEGATTYYLAGAGISPDQALAIVLIRHGFQFFFTTIVGLAFYYTAKYYNIPVIKRKSLEAVHSGASQPVKPNIIDVTRYEFNSLSTELGVRGSAGENIYISVVIPAFNETSRLPKTVLETIAWCNRNVSSYEMIIVDDGSSDDTFEVAKLCSEFDKNVKVIACPHQGKGAAVRMGMLNAVGEYVLFIDADGATPLSEIPKLISKMEEGYAIAIGSRVVQSPGETTVTSSLHRKVMGRVFAALVNIFAIRGIADTQCGFKMFKKGITRDLFSRQKLDGFAFDVEILYIAKKLSLPIAEVPVNWVNQKGSKVNPVMDGMKMLKDILKIRFMHDEISENRIYDIGTQENPFDLHLRIGK